MSYAKYTHRLTTEQTKLWSESANYRNSFRQMATHQARKVGAVDAFIANAQGVDLDGWSIDGNYQHGIY